MFWNKLKTPSVEEYTRIKRLITEHSTFFSNVECATNILQGRSTRYYLLTISINSKLSNSVISGSSFEEAFIRFTNSQNIPFVLINNVEIDVSTYTYLDIRYSIESQLRVEGFKVVHFNKG